MADGERIHEGDNVVGEDRLLRVAHGLVGQEARGAVAAQVGYDHPIAGLGQLRRYIDIAVDVVGPAVQQYDDRGVGLAGLGVGDVEDAGLNVSQRGGEVAGPRGRGGHSATAQSKLSHGDAYGGGPEQTAAVEVEGLVVHGGSP